MIARMDSAFYGHDVIAAVRRARARFSVTAPDEPQRQGRDRRSGPERVDGDPLPERVRRPRHRRTGSDAEVAEVAAFTTFTAFTSRPKKQQVTARFIVRRVKRLNTARPAARPKTCEGQEELFTTFYQWRHDAVFTDSPEAMLEAEATHRAHAVVEQVIAALKNGPLAHLPSGVFTPNAARLALAMIAFNLLRAAGAWPPTAPATALPWPPPRPYEPGSSPSPPGSPVPPAGPLCTCRPDGPGTSTGPSATDPSPRFRDERLGVVRVLDDDVALVAFVIEAEHGVRRQ
jgi:hypothetical protein